MAKKILGFAVFVFVILTISLVFFSYSSFSKASAQNTAQTPIRLEIGAWAIDYFPFIAQEKGYFKQNNVNVQLTLVPDYLQFIQGYASGQYDGIMTLYPDVMLLNNQGIDSKVVYSIDYSTKADVIIGKGNNLTEVKGQKI